MESQWHSSDTRRNSTRPVLQELATVAAAFVASRLLVFGTIYLSRLEIIRGPFWQPGSWFDVLTRGDAAAYLELARDLTTFGSPQYDPGIAFFPLYPLIVSIVAFVVRDVALAGVLVSNLSLLGAGWMLYRLADWEFSDERVSRASVMFLMFAPGALFFSTATAESTFLLLAIASLLMARRGRWAAASVCGILASSTMNLGYLLLAALLLELALQRRDRDRVRTTLRWADAALLAAIPALLFAGLFAGNARFDDPLALFRLAVDAELTFARLADVSSTFLSNRVFWEWGFGGTITIGSILCVAAFFAIRLRASYVVFAALLLAACALSHDIEAPRTMAVAFPLALTLGAIARTLDWSYESFLLCSAGLLTLVTLLFANGHWLT